MCTRAFRHLTNGAPCSAAGTAIGRGAKKQRYGYSMDESGKAARLKLLLSPVCSLWRLLFCLFVVFTNAQKKKKTKKEKLSVAAGKRNRLGEK